MWANEQEAAALSGYSPESFRSALAGLERAGFPQPNRLNKKRFIPAILDFWKRQVDNDEAIEPELEGKSESADQRHLENFNAGTHRQRRSA